MKNLHNYPFKFTKFPLNFAYDYKINLQSSTSQQRLFGTKRVPLSKLTV